MKTDIKAVCDGKGYWSKKSGREVKVEWLFMNYINDKKTLGELIAYFDKSTWDCSKDGLIYTDEGWMKDFRKGLAGLGFSEEAINEVSYSEQGMQSEEYVSMDVGSTFIKEFYEK